MSGSIAKGLVPLPLPLPLPDKEEVEAAADEACCWKKLPISLPKEERASRRLLRGGADMRVLAGLLPLPLPLLLLLPKLLSKEAAVVLAVVLALVLEELEALVLLLIFADDADADMVKGSSIAATGCLGGTLIVEAGWAAKGRLEMMVVLLPRPFGSLG
jgi:hypothetical protein